MSGEFEAAGAMATAGLVAGAIEGREGGLAHEGACLNCGAALNDRFCPHCGQAAHPHRSLLHIGEEVLHGLFHFDTKAWRTLPMVVFRPGTLTRNYVYGKRARYISPLALFLFTVFFMFFVFAFVNPPLDIGGTPQEQRADAIDQLGDARESAREARQALAEIRANPPAGEAPGLSERLGLQAVRLAEAEVQRREAVLSRIDAEAAGLRVQTSDPSAPAPAPSPPAAEGETAVPAPEPATNAVPDAPAATNVTRTWQEQISEWAGSDDFVVIDGMPELNERIRHKLENPDLALYKIQQAAYKYSFLLIPISLPFIWLLFLWKRGIALYDHVVFALYSLAFVSLLFVAVVSLTPLPWVRWLPGTLVTIGLPVHTYFHLKGAYALGWWSALWRSVFMLFFALFALVIFIITIVAVGLAG